MHRLERRPAASRRAIHAVPLLVDRPITPCRVVVDDDLSSVRGLVAGITLSVPVWAGLGYLAWKVLH